MATCTWIGGATNVAQVNSYAFGGTWIVGETITITYGQRTWVYTTTSTSIGTIITGLTAAYNLLSSSLYPEYAEQTAAGSATPWTLTADTAGKPFVVTVSTNSASGTITPSTPTASKGANDWSTATNWDGGAVPANGDTAIVDALNVQIKYGLSQSGVTLANLRIVTDRDTLFELGLPRSNVDGTPYAEYRTMSLTIGATLATVRSGGGRIKIAFGSVQTACSIEQTGSTKEQGVPSCLLTGTHASNAFEVLKGDVGLAFFGGESLVGLTTLQNGGNVNGGFGATLGTVTKNGGNFVHNGTLSTAVTLAGGKSTINGTTACPALTARGERVIWNSTGILGATSNPVLSNGSIFDFSQDASAKTLALPFKVYDNSIVNDPFKVVASPVAQVNSYAFGGSWIIGETITVTTNGEAYVYTIASATIATFLAALVAAYNILSRVTYPQQGKMIASGTGPLVMTAITAGTAFTQTVTTNSASGTIATTTPTGNSVGLQINYVESGLSGLGTNMTLTRS